jgi:hypothetical protein
MVAAASSKNLRAVGGLRRIVCVRHIRPLPAERDVGDDGALLAEKRGFLLKTPQFPVLGWFLTRLGGNRRPADANAVVGRPNRKEGQMPAA